MDTDNNITSLFLFHRDLRCIDNIGLHRLVQISHNIALLFIMTDEQTVNNNWFNQHAFNYQNELLRELAHRFNINFIKAKDEQSALKKVFAQNTIKRVYTNYDFTPFAQQRHQKTSLLCKKFSVEYKAFNDYLLLKPGTILNKNQHYFKVFTPFWKNVIQNSALIKQPAQTDLQAIQFQPLKGCWTWEQLNIPVTPSGYTINRQEAFEIIQKLPTKYEQWRNDLASPGGSGLSSAIKFGLISIREVIDAAVKAFHAFDNPFIRQVVWREFYYHVSYLAMCNKEWNFGENWNRAFNNVTWCNDKKLFHKWTAGKTGFLVVDAAMHQLNQTGFMHNRARLIVGSFLTKNLMFHWSWGEKYFAEKLVDYDPIVNQMSWQWVAGCGLDAAPYFRIFNPTLQQEKYDPNLIYCQKYLPANWNPPAIIDYKMSREQYLAIMKKQLTP